MTWQREIQAFPSLDPRCLLASAADDDPVLSGAEVRFYSSGRAALYRIIASQTYHKDSIILLPAFHCGVEVEAVIRAGCRPDFYPITRNLDINLACLQKKISPDTRAVLVTHFFGFPQKLDEVREICLRKNILLIEDCAHALYAKDRRDVWLGMQGDYAVFSMRKTVFMPNGGAVRCNRPGCMPPECGMSYNSANIYRTAIRSALDYQAERPGFLRHPSRWLLKLYSQYISEAFRSKAAESVTDPRWYYDVAVFDFKHDIAPISRICFRGAQADEIIALRRKNYRNLARLLRHGFSRQFLFNELPDGACPLCFPVFCEKREQVVDALSEQRVMPFVFGRHLHPFLNTTEHPEAAYLSDSIIGLPVHQQLCDEDMETIADTLCRVLER